VRSLSLAILWLINQEKLNTFLLVDIGPFTHVTSGERVSLHYTTLPYDTVAPCDDAITIGVAEGRFSTAANRASGTIPYSHNHTIASIDAPRISKVVDRAIFKIGFADPSFEMRNTLGVGIPGSGLRVRTGFVKPLLMKSDGSGFQKIPDTDTLLNGENHDEFVTIYSGVIDTQAYSIDPEGETILTFEGSSPMGPLGLVRTVMSSGDWMSNRYPGDTCCDQNYIGSRPAQIKWGKQRG
jgi:hypothetical protein